MRGGAAHLRLGVVGEGGLLVTLGLAPAFALALALGLDGPLMVAEVAGERHRQCV
jgi:hypothetical protein